MAKTTGFHDGELAVQQRAGAEAEARNSGRMISDAIIPGALKFVSKQSMVFVGSVDSNGNAWSSALVGPPGFLHAESRSLEIDLSRCPDLPHDPLRDNLAQNPQIGLLVIDLRSRARLRVNGRAEFPTPQRLRVIVRDAYPNCPKYIQRRDFRPDFSLANRPVVRCTIGVDYDMEIRRWIAGADTFFVASHAPGGGVDVSHRGGNPGFIDVLDATRLQIPDYVGNGMFNTLGNFAVNPRAGLLFPDFESSRVLQLTGRTKILWDVADPDGKSGGTRRFWEFRVDAWIRCEAALRGSVEFLDSSPHNPGSRP